MLTWGLLSALGVSALVAANQLAYDVLHVAGAVYLIYLGVRALTKHPLSGAVLLAFGLRLGAETR